MAAEEQDIEQFMHQKQSQFQSSAPGEELSAIYPVKDRAHQTIVHSDSFVDKQDAPAGYSSVTEEELSDEESIEKRTISIEQ